jgi:purine-cytosine permease-like protein
MHKILYLSLKRFLGFIILIVVVDLLLAIKNHESINKYFSSDFRFTLVWVIPIIIVVTIIEYFIKNKKNDINKSK